MLTAYLSTLIIGGSLLLLSIFAGGDHEMDHEVEFDSDFETDADLDGDHSGLDLHGFDAWLPIGSLRFWTFFCAFFGLVGTAILVTNSMSTTLSLVPSIGVGYTTGLVATRLLRSLTKNSVGKVVGPRELIGSTGKLMLPVGEQVLGKVRMQIGGRSIEQTAYSDETIAAGEPVLVISIHEDGGVWVSPAPLLKG